MLRGSAIVVALGVGGLALGFLREWLLVHAWGAGGLSDGFVVGVFLPEALRVSLSTGVIGSVGLALWQERRGEGGAAWAALLGGQLTLLGGLLAGLAAGFPEELVGWVGPGLAADSLAVGAEVLRTAAWVLPFLFLAAWLTIFHHAEERFFWAATGGVFFNFPPVLYLLASGPEARPDTLAAMQVMGAAISCGVLLPDAWRAGWRPWGRGLPWRGSLLFYRRLGPLLAASGASQAGLWLERALASFLDAGAVTLVHLARKIMGLPAMAVVALAQVALARLVGSGRREAVLAQGLGLAAVFGAPAALLSSASAPLLAGWVVPDSEAKAQLAALVALFSLALVAAGWNALLARWFYAHGDTLTPTRVEVMGVAVQMVVTLLLFPLLDLYSFPLGALAGVGYTWWRLHARTPLAEGRSAALGFLSLLAVVLAGLWYWPLSWQSPGHVVPALSVLVAVGVGLGLGLARRLREVVG